jgi:hypothetical protein
MTAETLVWEADGLPQVPSYPAPWLLRGSGYVIAVRMSEDVLQQQSFVPPSLAGKEHGRTAAVMLFNYESSNCGPYRELLIAPAVFDFPQGHFASITRIYVSSYESVVNGRKNWGIPKDYAEFAVSRGDDQVEQVALSRAGHVFAEFQLKAWGPRLPAYGNLLPASLRTLVQHWRGKSYSLTLQAKGSMRMAKLLDWRFDPAYFPDLSRCRVLTAMYLPSFEMTFPVAGVQDIPRAADGSADGMHSAPPRS